MTVENLQFNDTQAFKSNEQAIAVANDLFAKEAQAILTLKENMSGEFGVSFIKALELILANKGRLVVTGMGKSGHIGAKIAATLASTGTPSFFVHPSEASHGDLGMVSQEDMVLAIGHSGESRELSDIIAYCGRFKVPLIAITGKSESSLAKAADVVLLNGVTEEACPMKLAPTSSTTAVLAIGDALAVSLMQRRGFQAEDFRKFHPGGKLGSSLSYVRDLMHVNDEIPLLSIQDTMDKAILEISQKRLGMTGVIDEFASGVLVGVITDGDLRRSLTSQQLSPELLLQNVQEVMSNNPLTVTEDCLASRAVNIMQENSITALFVVNNQEQPVGVIHIHDCLKAGIV